MKTQRKVSSINLPVWMDAAVRDLAQKEKRTLSGQIEFLVEEALKNEAICPDSLYIHEGTGPVMEAVNV